MCSENIRYKIRFPVIYYFICLSSSYTPFCFSSFSFLSLSLLLHTIYLTLDPICIKIHNSTTPFSNSPPLCVCREEGNVFFYRKGKKETHLSPSLSLSLFHFFSRPKQHQLSLFSSIFKAKKKNYILFIILFPYLHPLSHSHSLQSTTTVLMMTDQFISIHVCVCHNDHSFFLFTAEQINKSINK